MEIKAYKKGNEQQIFDLFKLTFGRPINPKYWYWRFQDNPAGKHFIKLMWDNDTLAGHYAVSPVIMNVNGQKELTTLSMTTMTHPDYGRRGIFGTLANELYSDIENNHNVKAIWGFPNNNSHYGFIKNLSWKDLAVINHLVKNTVGIKGELSPNIRKVDSFKEIHSAIMQRITENFQVYVDRSVEYLNWRYILNPNVEYSIFEYIDNNEVIGFFVVKNYFNNESKTQNLFIIEIGLQHDHINLIPEFTNHLLAYYQNIATINLWLPLSDKRYIYFEKNAFFVGGKPTYLGVRANNSQADIINQYNNWYYSYGDSDVY